VRALIIDFETTGLPFHPDAKPALQPRAIEFAGMLVDGHGEMIAEDSWLAKPPHDIDAVITKITGLTNEDLADAPPFIENLPRLRAMFDGVDVLIAHNLPFDAGVLANELRFANALDGWPWPRHLLCTVQTFEPIWGRRPKLIELFEATTGGVYQQTHRALDDVRALAAIVRQERLLDLIAAAPCSERIQFPPYLWTHPEAGRAAG